MSLPSPHLFPTFCLPVHFPISPSSLTDIQYKYTLWLYIAFGSAKKWLTKALAELTGIYRKEEILMFI